MFDLIEDIMSFIYRHQIIRRIAWQLIITFISIFIFLTILFWFNFKKMGYSSFDFNLLLNVQAYTFLIKEYAREIAYFLIIEQVLFILLLWYMSNKLSKPSKDNEIIKIDIKDLAKIWLESDNVPMVDTSKLATEKANTIMANRQMRDSIISLANLKQDASQIFLNDIIKPNLEKIHPKHLEMIIKLLQLLEENITCPSVVQLFEGDPNSAYGKLPAKRKEGERVDTVTLDGKTRFDIYERISLLRHSLHVAYKIIELLNDSKEYKSFKKTLFGKAIIVALGHDIGKISKFNLRESYIKEQRLEGNTKTAFNSLRRMQEHQKISYIIFYELFKNYPDLKELAATVQNHHLGSIDKNDKLLKLLIDADKQTREYELDAYLQNSEEFEKIRAKELENIIITVPQKNNIVQKKSQNIQNKTKDENITNEISILELKELQERFALNFSEYKKQFFLFTMDHNTKELQELIFNFKFKNTEKEFYKDKKDLFVLVECGVINGNRTDTMNYFYDLSDEINKKLNKKIKIGFAMFRDCKDINEAISGCAKTLEHIKNNSQVIYSDYKDFKISTNDKILISDNAELTTEDEISQEEVNATDINEQSSILKENIDTQSIEKIFEIAENKIQEVEYSLNQEENFDISLIEVKFLEILKSKINTFKRKGFSKLVQAVSYKKFVLFSRECLLESLADALNVKNKDIEAKLNFLIRYYRNHSDENKRLIWFVNVNKGFYHSTYLLNSNEKQEEYQEFFCIPFDGNRSFGMSASELSIHKDNSSLRNYNIKPYVKKDK
ncbi:HD domain-containing protein [Campylobacter coli]|nr:HD domain-containing protein [Campylobacter coli]EKJ5652817.1 HD domain-containing protein [Campylobacter coli]EKJ6088994.1 HD domain-containing protein [Campylobacter coli]